MAQDGGAASAGACEHRCSARAGPPRSCGCQMHVGCKVVRSRLGCRALLCSGGLCSLQRFQAFAEPVCISRLGGTRRAHNRCSSHNRCLRIRGGGSGNRVVEESIDRGDQQGRRRRTVVEEGIQADGAWDDRFHRVWYRERIGADRGKRGRHHGRKRTRGSGGGGGLGGRGTEGAGSGDGGGLGGGGKRAGDGDWGGLRLRAERADDRDRRCGHGRRLRRRAEGRLHLGLAMRFRLGRGQMRFESRTHAAAVVRSEDVQQAARDVLDLDGECDRVCGIDDASTHTRQGVSCYRGLGRGVGNDELGLGNAQQDARTVARDRRLRLELLQRGGGLRAAGEDHGAGIEDGDRDGRGILARCCVQELDIRRRKKADAVGQGTLPQTGRGHLEDGKHVTLAQREGRVVIDARQVVHARNSPALAVRADAVAAHPGDQLLADGRGLLGGVALDKIERGLALGVAGERVHAGREQHRDDWPAAEERSLVQRRADLAHGPQVRPVLEQQLHDVLVAVAHGDKQRAALRRCVLQQLRALGQQDGDAAGAPVLRSEIEGRLIGLVAKVCIDAELEKEYDHVRVPVLCATV
eukprot:m.47376 g.47376  ORF g.47376 m.47376 type:complete len:580 (-) comp5975_c0_seq1:406-2145(-)